MADFLSVFVPLLLLAAVADYCICPDALSDDLQKMLHDGGTNG